jgi:hypothetical protein
MEGCYVDELVRIWKETAVAWFEGNITDFTGGRGLGKTAKTQVRIAGHRAEIWIEFFLLLKAKPVPLRVKKALGGRWREAPTPGTHWTGGWVDPSANLDTEARGKILSPLPGFEPRSPGCLARSQTLYWLSYPAPLFLAVTLPKPNSETIDISADITMCRGRGQFWGV